MIQTETFYETWQQAAYLDRQIEDLQMELSVITAITDYVEDETNEPVVILNIRGGIQYNPYLYLK